MEDIAARICDHVVNVARSAAELRGEAVGHGLDFLHVGLRDGKEAEAVAVSLRVHHAVHLVVDAVHQAIGVDGSRNAQLRVGVTAHPRLEEDEVIRVARAQWQVKDFALVNRTPQVDTRRLDDRCPALDFDRFGNCAQLQLGVYHSFCPRRQHDVRVLQDREALLLYVHPVSPQSKVGEDIVALGPGIEGTRDAAGRLADGDGGVGHARTRGVSHSSPDGGIDGLRLSPHRHRSHRQDQKQECAEEKMNPEDQRSTFGHGYHRLAYGTCHRLHSSVERLCAMNALNESLYFQSSGTRNFTLLYFSSGRSRTVFYCNTIVKCVTHSSPSHG